jgi:hypothetical protein
MVGGEQMNGLQLGAGSGLGSRDSPELRAR